MSAFRRHGNKNFIVSVNIRAGCAAGKPFNLACTVVPGSEKPDKVTVAMVEL